MIKAIFEVPRPELCDEILRPIFLKFKLLWCVMKPVFSFLLTFSNSWCCQINMCVYFDISRYFKQTFLCKGKHSKLNKNKNLFAVCWTFYDLEKTFVMTNFNNSIIAKIVRFLAPQKCFSSFELKCVVRNANNEKHWQQKN